MTQKNIATNVPDEKVTQFNPPLDVMEPATSEETPIKTPTKKTLVRCPDCPWKAGLKYGGEGLCDTCSGTGKVEADPLE